MLILWMQFLLIIALIWAAGVRLSRYGDVIAEKAGLSRTWIGVTLLATVTSLPELVTGISAVALAHAPNIALGDILGSCVFNLVILAILDVLHRGESMYVRARQGHILAAGFGIILIGFVALNLLLAEHGAVMSIRHVGGYTPIIIAVYLVAIRTVFRYERQQMTTFVEEVAERHAHVTLRQAILRYTLAALVVVGMGTWLPFVGETMATVMGWHKSFVGTLFVAFATSVPEVAVTVAAWRIGALDMAIGNLLGSNLFNIVILAVDDALFLQGPILSHVSSAHALSAVSAMMMTGLAVVGLLYRPKTRLFGRVGWTSLALSSLYVLNALVLFRYER